jgi:predicted enzyme related to lactoylglutathione lyase
MADAMKPVNWFEIPAKDLKRAKAFYEHVLGVELSLNEMGPLKMAWFPMHQNAPGSTGSLVQADAYEPSHKGSMVYFSVASIEDALKKIESKGGKVLRPKMSIGEYGFVAHFEDCEGNRVALHATS